MDSRQIESLRHATEELNTSARQRHPDISGTLSLAALVFETSTDLEGETLWEFLEALHAAVTAAADDYNDEEDD